MRRAFGSAAVCFLTTLAPVAAQSIRGRVVLPDSTTPLGGVILVIRSAQGSTAGRAITDARGAFASPSLAPGRYSIQLLRIGYSPSAGPSVDVAAAATADVRIVFSAPPISLTAINVRERETCRVGADSGLAVARVWGEARKAMLGSQLATATSAPPLAAWIEYDRILDPSGRAVLEQHVRAAQHPTAHAFRSRPAEELASNGYIVSDGSGTTYYAPDADVLLSESFAATHCFRLQREPDRSNLIGVAFTPVPSRRDARDIEGTFWIDANTSELQSLDFRYTGLPDALAGVGAGGRVEFRRLADGNWLVSRWNVRMPQLSAADRSPGMSGTPGVPLSRLPAVKAVQVTGGEVSRLTRGDSVVYQASGPSLNVQIVGALDSVLPAMGARLALDGTSYQAAADPTGRIRMSPVLAGRYRARLSTPLMDSLRVQPVTGEVEVREDAHVDTLKLPMPGAVVAAVCSRDSVRHGEGMLYGRVRDERARPIEQAAVTASWQGDFAVVGTRAGDELSFRQRSIGTFSGIAGLWRLCGVPRGTSILVRVASDSGTDRRTVRLDSVRAFVPVDLVAHHEIAAFKREANDALGEIRRETALVELSVVSADGVPLSEVRLDVRPANGPSQTLLTGPSGRALLPDVTPGPLTVQARRIGFLPGKASASVAAGRNTVPIILSQATLPTLDTVRVLGDRRVVGLMRNDEFDTRRFNHAATASSTRADIVKRNPVDLWQMITNVPSIRVIDSSAVTAQSTRSDLVTPSGARVPCYISVMVDGIIKNPLGDPFDLRALPRPDEVYGIEVFAGASSIPLQYGGTGSGKWCGMIAVWTR